MAKKKKEEEEEKKIYQKKQTTTEKGTRLTSGNVLEETAPNKFKQKKFKGSESPAAVRLKELSGGKGFIAQGTPEFAQLQKEFPLESRGFYDPEERQFFDPSLTPFQLKLEEQQLQEQAAQQQQQQEILETAEETGVFEPRPERVELSPTKEEVKGQTYSASRERADIEFIKSVTGKEPEAYAKELGISEEGLNDLIQNPETKKQLMIQQIQKEELGKSSTISQKLGALLEPFIGDLKFLDVDIGKYADKIVRMPTKEVYLIVDQIAELESSVSGMTDSASQGEIGNPAEVLRDIASKENDLAKYEARIKRLIIASVELRANPEQVNLIEEKILSARETLFEAKQRAAEGALITPTDGQLYLKLNEIRKGVKNES